MKISKLREVNRRLLSLLFVIGWIFLPISKGKTERSISKGQPDKKIVSAFDEDNIASNQYGANQRVFDKDTILTSSHVLEVMQKYKPRSDFNSTGEALNYYKSFLNQIFEQGCADAAICDVIYHFLENTPDIFEKCFGFPMCELDEYGNIDYNYEALMVDIFCNRLSKIPNGWKMMDQIIQKDMYKFELNRYMTSGEWTRKKPDNLSGKELEEWKEFEKKRDDTFRELNKKYSDAPEVSFDLGMDSSNHEVDISFYIASYLGEHYLDSGVSFPIDDIKPGDMIASRGFKFYTDEEGNHDDLTLGEIGSHWFYVTDVTRDGKIIASSWGKKYIFEPPKITNFNKKYVMIVRISISPNSKINYR